VSKGIGTKVREGWGVTVVLVAAVGIAVAPASAQDPDQIPGVSLGLVYETAYQPSLAIKPFSGRFGGGGIARDVETIIGRDLRNSDRFQVLDELPAGMADDRVDYSLWDRIGADWVVDGQVEGAGEGYVLVLSVHDVVYGAVRESERFRLPGPGDPDFRMAVHRASDDIVRWITGEPGMAASRISFTMTDASGNKDIYIIDSDGENLRRLTDEQALVESPAWSPDGRKIAFSSWTTGVPRIYELDVVTGERKMLPEVRGAGDYITPAYHPDGRTLAFSVLGRGGQSGIFTYDIAQNCCLSYLSGGPWYDLSPTYSPDGRWMAFNTLRFGDAVPQIMLMPAQGGAAETLSPYEYGRGGYYTSPDWSPFGDRVAFHGRIERGRYHILVASLADGGRVLRQLTSEGNNEDPSWAPDGRHIVFVGERSWGYGLFVVDAATGRIRALMSGRRVGVPDWSPSLR
jgi:TolB protein